MKLYFWGPNLLVLAPFQVHLPQSFRELSQLTNSELNCLLRSLNLAVKGKRSHKFTIIANHLSIPTNGENESDPFLLTLNDIKHTKDGWTKDLRQIPDLRLQDVLKYLLAVHDISCGNDQGDFEPYNESSLKSYKALRSHDLWESGHLSGFCFNPLHDHADYCAIKGLANPSGDTSGTQYDVVVILKENGKPVGASCSCVAGQGEACTHIAGLLFGLEDFVSRGYKSLKDEEATTDKLCKWIVPKGPKVEPKPLKDVKVKKKCTWQSRKRQKV